MVEGFDTSALVPEYLEDARGHLDRLDHSLLEMEKDKGGEDLDVEHVSDLLGSLHTLKGNSGMMGFGSLQQYIHKLEGALKGLLEGKYPLDDSFMQALFDAAATLREAVEGIEKEPGSQPELSKDEKALEDAIAEASGLAAASASPAAAPKKRPQASSKADSFSYIGARSNVLKVDFERLDHLLNLAGELVIHRTKLAQVDSRFKEEYKDKDLSWELSEATALIHKATSDLQEAIMKVRMLPIKQVFQRFPRMVRDLSRERGKEVELIFKGEDTELDKSVIDEIGEPLMHLIRNSVDHGLETPDERLRNNKSTVGKVSLCASQEGNHIIITVGDDGKGIDVDAVKAKAASFQSREALDSMGRENLMELIFEPGFSTAREVTEVSGRGVGLDVVKKNVARLGGIVEVASEKGRGTTFTIKLPLTLAIISALMVGIGPELYSIPLSSVVESLKITLGDIQTINGREVIKLRDRVLPLIRLSRLFGAPVAGDDSDRTYVVVVGRAEKRVGIVVDRLMGRQEVVIKALDEYIGDSEGIAGATILGDGRVVLILDVAGLIEKNLMKTERRAG